MSKIKNIMNNKKILIPVLTLALIFSATVFLRRNYKYTNSAENNVFEKFEKIDAVLVHRSIDDLLEMSSLAIIGTYSGESESFQIRTPFDGVMNHTDFYIDVSEVLRGETEDLSIAVRVEGGTVGEHTEIHNPTVNFEVGQEYLLFLFQERSGGGFETVGEHFYILGHTQGIFSEKNSKRYISQDGVILMKKYLYAHINDVPVDKDYFRKQFLKSLKGNLESGFMGQEEHDMWLSNLDTYAKVVLIVNGIKLDYDIIDGIVVIKPTQEQMTAILEYPGDDIVFNLRPIGTSTDIYVVGTWFNGYDKIFL